MAFIRSISKRFTTAARTLAKDENGGELVEWVLLLGLIVVVCFIGMSVFGATLHERWNEFVDDL